ncbi:MAG: response regulator [Magnetococcales bacterium]|nr:response regulator [Magnetococcales bacterium]
MTAIAPVQIRILLVDDDPTGRDVASQRLRSRGYRVHVSEEGRSALALLGREPFDVVFTDIRMPGMDGLTLARELRGLEDRQLALIPLVALTADPSSENSEECLAAGFDAVMHKPLRLDDIQELLVGLLGVERMPGREADRESNHTREESIPLLDEQVLEQICQALPWERVCQFPDLFTQTEKRAARELAVAQQSGDYAALAKGAHLLLGAARNLGMVALMRLASEVEILAAEGASDKLDERVARIPALGQHSLEAMKGWLERWQRSNISG